MEADAFRDIAASNEFLAALAGVYLEHDMVGDSLVAIREATQIEPQNLAYLVNAQTTRFSPRAIAKL